MGQAKKRGTREQRVAEAVERNRIEAEQRDLEIQAKRVSWTLTRNAKPATPRRARSRSLGLAIALSAMGMGVHHG